MASDIEMSLEDIIKRKKKAPVRKTQNGEKTLFSQNTALKKGLAIPVPKGDARNKLIIKRRKQIGDLRDKLASLSKKKDVRLKLETLRMKKAPFPTSRREFVYNMRGLNSRRQKNLGVNMHEGFTDLTRQVSSRPARMPALPKFHIDRQIEYADFYTGRKKSASLRSDRFRGVHTSLKPIVRTVENDTYIATAPIEIDDDIDMELEMQPYGPRAPPVNLKIVTRNDHAFSGEKRSEHMPPSILKKPRALAPLHMDRERRPSPPGSGPEYRIVVSNLRSSVTETDIRELFGDVGELVESRLVRPGTAEVLYASLDDAQRAVDLYHNRQLDGQPMNCLLVNPRHSAPAGSRLGGSKSVPAASSSIVPDIETFHKVLFASRR